MIVVVGVMMIAAGHGWAREPRVVRSLLEARHDNVVLQEWDLSCGAAAITTILNYQFGEVVTEREVARTLMQRAKYIENPELVNLQEGFSLLDLKRLVDGLGYEGIGFGQVELEALLERAPAIVPINTHGYNHFVVVRGMAGDRILMADPAWGNRTMTRDDFVRAWIDYDDFGHVAFVVTRDGEIAPAAGLAPALDHFLTFN